MVNRLIAAVFCAALCLATSPVMVPSPSPEPSVIEPPSPSPEPSSRVPFWKRFSFSKYVYQYLSEIVEAVNANDVRGANVMKEKRDSEDSVVQEERWWAFVWRMVKFVFKLMIKLIQVILRPVTNWFTTGLPKWFEQKAKAMVAFVERIDAFGKQIEKDREFYGSVMKGMADDWNAIEKENERMFNNRKRPFK